MTVVPMTALLPMLFVAAAAIACGIIGLTLKHYMPDIRSLRSALRVPEDGAELRITYRPDSYCPQAIEIEALRAVRRKRHHDVRATKWTAHRLHHFSHDRSAA